MLLGLDLIGGYIFYKHNIYLWQLLGILISFHLVEICFYFASVNVRP